jgi:hypothetical protein
MNTEFNEVEFNLAYPDGVENTYWQRARNYIIYRTIKRAGLSGSPILEIGCGRGLVVNYLSKKNINCFGIELAKAEPIEGVERKILTSTNALDTSEDFAGRFNTILLLDVVEHIEDDAGFIKSISVKYNKVTHLVISVPARKEIWTNFDDFYRHYRRYDIKELTALIHKTGFEVVDIRYTFKSVYLLVLLFNKFKIRRKVQTPVPPNSVMKLAHIIIGWLFMLEYIIMPKSMYGSSIFCVARKKT